MSSYGKAHDRYDYNAKPSNFTIEFEDVRKNIFKLGLIARLNLLGI
jgi:hypothetical protein